MPQQQAGNDDVKQVTFAGVTAEPTSTIHWNGDRYAIYVKAIVITEPLEAYPRQRLFISGPEGEVAEVTGDVESGPNPRVAIPISPALAANVRRVFEARPLRSEGFVPAGDVYDASGKQIQPKAETAQSLFDRGLEHEYRGEQDQAIDLYTKAIKANPRSAPAFFRRCVQRIYRREFDKAQQDFAEAIRLDPKDAGRYYSARGDAWAVGELDKALADYSEAIRLLPNDQQTYTSRAKLWVRRGERRKALADYNEAIRLAGQSEDARWSAPYAERAALLAELGEVDKAIGAYTEILGWREGDVEARTARGNLWWKKNNLDKALQDFTEAVHNGSEWESAQIALAWFLSTADDRRYRSSGRALEHATRACELSDWRSGGSLDTLAAAHAEAGDFALAAAWQAKAIELMQQEGQKPSAADLKRSEERLELYRSGKPYREQVSPATKDAAVDAKTPGGKG
jgi:tetratricopeptide (TPR) repeat protein